MIRRVAWLALFGAAIGVVVCLAFLIRDANPATQSPEGAAKDRLAREAAIARIAVESKMIDAPGAQGVSATVVRAEAPPGFQPAPSVAHEATPPEGYAFVSTHEINRAPMSDDGIDHAGLATAPPAWMDVGHLALADQAAAAGRDWTFGWLKLAQGADLDVLRALLATHGGEFLGHAGDLVRARLPGDATGLQAIANSESVAGMGGLPAARKITDTLAAARELAGSSERVPVWITLMDDDPDGRWRRALKALGAEVGHFDPTIRTYAATVSLDALEPLAASDYVLAVETIGRVEPTLERAVPAMGADALRVYDAASAMFTGVAGATVAVGVMDTGLNIDHPDISTNRRSICGANFTSLAVSRQQDQDLWIDAIGHGTHVTGIVLGNGATNPQRAGMAPLVQDIRFAKSVSSDGGASALGWGRAMDWFAEPTACGEGEAQKALVINSSLGVSADVWEGRSVVERKIDASVWQSRQLFVTAAGNGSDLTMASMAGAKNALSVGAAQNIGDIASFSSRGPTSDGRLMPKIVGTGVDVVSTAGEASRGGYYRSSGTSMSSPSVAGVAALVMDALPALREEPAAVRARLLASAIKPDAFLADPAVFPLNNTNGPGSLQNFYGLGKVSARTAVLNHDTEDGWVGGSAAFEIDAGSYAYRDIVVPQGASRLDVVMTWDEPPADTISSAVLQDLDLWVDRDISCQVIRACGDYRSRSRIDNVEWVIVPNPPAGVYRVKVVPNRIYGESPRAGLAWTVIRGASTPTLSVATDQESVHVAPGEAFEIEVTMSSDSYVATGANLRIDCLAPPNTDACRDLSYINLGDSSAQREDGVERSLARDSDAAIVVGEIGPDERQTVSLRILDQAEGSFRLNFAASAWNATSASISVAVVAGQPASDPPAPAMKPPNDEFAAAIPVDGAEGETTFDLVLATPEPGEPAYPFGAGDPLRPRSLWYTWTAPETALARFTVAQTSTNDYADNVIVEVFRGDAPSSLVPVNTPQLGGGTTFFADAGQAYKLRLAVADAGLIHSELNPLGFGLVRRRSTTPSLTLHWGPGNRPGNDNYVLAAVIEGDPGQTLGNNQGATLEADEVIGGAHPESPEFVHGKAASVWHRWTAPWTGDWRFSVNRRGMTVSAFVGDSMAEARLVSGAPGLVFGVPDSAVFPAVEGVEYRIAVASASAYFSGSDFTLAWAPGFRIGAPNDDFAAAVHATGDFALATFDLNGTTVEHGEPIESGSRTVWYGWQPTTEGRYTWQLRPFGFQSPLGEAPMQMSVFVGDALSTLEPVAVDVGDETMDFAMTFDAHPEATYRFALGLPRDAAETVIPSFQIFILYWGPTPENDDRGNAITLTGESGTIVGSNQFATSERGEKTGTLGDGSLWWEFEAAQSGWMRFGLDGPSGMKLAIYKIASDGLELVGVSRQFGVTAATFRVESGARYLVRLGSSYEHFGSEGRGDFELSWSPTDAPVGLRFAGHVYSGQVGEDGMPVDLAVIPSMAFNGDGTQLYAGSRAGTEFYDSPEAAGLVIFDRDTDTGELTGVETLSQYPIDSGTRLIWDDAGSSLLVVSCAGWRRFAPGEGGGLDYVGDVAGAPCPGDSLLLDGDFAYVVTSPWMIETYQFDEARQFIGLVEQLAVIDVRTAVMTADGANLYAATDNSLLVIDRDADTGSLSIVRVLANGTATGDGGDNIIEGLSGIQALAVHDTLLFVSAGPGGTDTLVFDLADRRQPLFRGVLASFVHDDGGIFGPFPGSGPENCRFPVARSDATAVDVACAEGIVYTVQVASAGTLLAADVVRADGESSDGYGNRIPASSVTSVIGSPDGRHLYLAGVESGSFFSFSTNGQVLVFERVSEE